MAMPINVTVPNADRADALNEKLSHLVRLLAIAAARMEMRRLIEAKDGQS